MWIFQYTNWVSRWLGSTWCECWATGLYMYRGRLFVVHSKTWKVHLRCMAWGFVMWDRSNDDACEGLRLPSMRVERKDVWTWHKMWLLKSLQQVHASLEFAQILFLLYVRAHKSSKIQFAKGINLFAHKKISRYHSLCRSAYSHAGGGGGGRDLAQLQAAIIPTPRILMASELVQAGG